MYNYNANTVYFDGIQLFKEQFGSSYTYDGNGNVTSVVDLQKQETTYEYTNNNLTKIIQNGKAKMTYVYDAYHNVTKATTATTATTGEGLVYEFAYDTYGNNTSVSIVNGNTRITSSADYSDDGNILESTTDALDKTTTYGYNRDTNVLEWVEYPNDTEDTRTEYSYDSMYRLARASVTVEPNCNYLSASYTYTDDLLTKIQTNSTTYNFSYGDFSQRTGVSIGTRTLATYSYTNNQNRYLQQLTYGNGDYVQYTYDSHGRVVRETYEDGSTVSYAYDNSGALATVTDSETGITTKYYYDLTDRMMKYVESGDGYSHSVGYEYDTLNNLTHLVETINGVKHTTEYGYDDDNRVTSITNGIHNGTVNQEARRDYIYDDFGRVIQRVTKHGESVLLTETITYVGNSTQVASITTVSDGYTVTYSYTYDNNGNISTVSDGTNITRYLYDSANQLVREDNEAAGKSWMRHYDTAGNITGYLTYDYSLNYNYMLTPGNDVQPTDVIWNTYGDSNWGDLLTEYDGIPITYDEIGNPVTENGYTVYTWKNGRQLASAEGAMGYVWTYTYDANGMRIGKQRDLGGPSYSYVYNGGQLMQMSVGTDTYSFTYDASGTPMTISHNGTVYYYVTNLQGDVVAIVDSAGAQVVGYTYDAWGKVLSKTGTMAWSLGEENPLRYRGYVYDPETGLYYVTSRYYDPEIGRWINADSFLADVGGNVNGYNLFAYCFNNPVNMDDPNGEWPKWVSGAWNVVGGSMQVAAGAALGATVGWTGFGAVVAGFLIINGTATTAQGVGQIVNYVANSNVMCEDNVVRTGAQEVGRAIGGETGAVIAGGVYDVAVVTANLYAGKVGLQQAGKLPIKVSINKVVNNPSDEFVTIGPADGVIQQYCRTIPQSGYGKIYATQLGNGLYQIANGHHRVAALRALGYDTVKIFLTK